MSRSIDRENLNFLLSYCSHHQIGIEYSIPMLLKWMNLDKKDFEERYSLTLEVFVDHLSHIEISTKVRAIVFDIFGFIPDALPVRKYVLPRRVNVVNGIQSLYEFNYRHNVGVYWSFEQMRVLQRVSRQPITKIVGLTDYKTIFKLLKKPMFNPEIRKNIYHVMDYDHWAIIDKMSYGPKMRCGHKNQTLLVEYIARGLPLGQSLRFLLFLNHIGLNEVSSSLGCTAKNLEKMLLQDQILNIKVREALEKILNITFKNSWVISCD